MTIDCLICLNKMDSATVTEENGFAICSSCGALIALDPALNMVTLKRDEKRLTIVYRWLGQGSLFALLLGIIAFTAVTIAFTSLLLWTFATGPHIFITLLLLLVISITAIADFFAISHLIATIFNKTTYTLNANTSVSIYSGPIIFCVKKPICFENITAIEEKKDSVEWHVRSRVRTIYYTTLNIRDSKGRMSELYAYEDFDRVGEFICRTIKAYLIEHLPPVEEDI